TPQRTNLTPTCPRRAPARVKGTQKRSGPRGRSPGLQTLFSQFRAVVGVIGTEGVVVIVIQRVADSRRGSPTPRNGESGTLMLCWSLMVELAAWAGRGHQAGANRQATREAGHRDGHQRPRISAAGSPGSRRCSWDPTVAAATGTPSCAEANAPIGSGWPVSRIAAWVAAAPTPSTIPSRITTGADRAHADQATRLATRRTADRGTLRSPRRAGGPAVVVHRRPRPRVRRRTRPA